MLEPINGSPYSLGIHAAGSCRPSSTEELLKKCMLPDAPKKRQNRVVRIRKTSQESISLSSIGNGRLSAKLKYNGFSFEYVLDTVYTDFWSNDLGRVKGSVQSGKVVVHGLCMFKTSALTSNFLTIGEDTMTSCQYMPYWCEHSDMAYVLDIMHEDWLQNSMRSSCQFTPCVTISEFSVDERKTKTLLPICVLVFEPKPLVTMTMSAIYKALAETRTVDLDLVAYLCIFSSPHADAWNSKDPRLIMQAIEEVSGEHASRGCKKFLRGMFNVLRGAQYRTRRFDYMDTFARLLDSYWLDNVEARRQAMFNGRSSRFRVLSHDLVKRIWEDAHGVEDYFGVLRVPTHVSDMHRRWNFQGLYSPGIHAAGSCRPSSTEELVNFMLPDAPKKKQNRVMRIRKTTNEKFSLRSVGDGRLSATLQNRGFPFEYVLDTAYTDFWRADIGRVNGSLQSGKVVAHALCMFNPLDNGTHPPTPTCAPNTDMSFMIIGGKQMQACRTMRNSEVSDISSVLEHMHSEWLYNNISLCCNVVPCIAISEFSVDENKKKTLIPICVLVFEPNPFTITMTMPAIYKALTETRNVNLDMLAYLCIFRSPHADAWNSKNGRLIMQAVEAVSSDHASRGCKFFLKEMFLVLTARDTSSRDYKNEFASLLDSYWLHTFKVMRDATFNGRSSRFRKLPNDLVKRIWENAHGIDDKFVLFRAPHNVHMMHRFWNFYVCVLVGSS